MCNPAIAMLAVSAVSAGVQIQGQQQQAKQQESWNKYQTAQANADANAERGAAEVNAERIRKVARMKASSANAASAASGVVTGAGTAQMIQEDIIGSAEEDAQMTVFSGKDAASRLDAEGQAYKIQGQTARSNANAASMSTLASAASSGYSNWKAM